MVGAEQGPGIDLGLDLLEPPVDRVREEPAGVGRTALGEVGVPPAGVPRPNGLEECPRSASRVAAIPPGVAALPPPSSAPDSSQNTNTGPSGDERRTGC